MEVYMYVVLGASGNTGQVVAKNLLARGQKVRVVGRNAARLQPLAAEAAELFIGDATDAPTLTKAFHGADSAYALTPPDPASNDFRAFQDRVSDAIATAIQNAGVKNVVSLSSFGADKASGTSSARAPHERAACERLSSSAPNGYAWPDSTSSREKLQPRSRICSARSGRRFPSTPRRVPWPVC